MHKTYLRIRPSEVLIGKGVLKISANLQEHTHAKV